MTELLNAEFADETGTVRRLPREELLIYLNVVAGAGNETILSATPRTATTGRSVIRRS